MEKPRAWWGGKNLLTHLSYRPLKNRSRFTCSLPIRMRVYLRHAYRSYPRNFPMDDVSSEMTEWRAAEGTPREARFVSELTGWAARAGRAALPCLLQMTTERRSFKEARKDKATTEVEGI